MACAKCGGNVQGELPNADRLEACSCTLEPRTRAQAVRESEMGQTATATPKASPRPDSAAVEPFPTVPRLTELQAGPRAWAPSGVR